MTSGRCGMSEPLDLDAIRAELEQVARDVDVPAYRGDVEHFTGAWANIGRHVPALLAELERLRPVAEAARVAAQPLAKMTRYFPDLAGRSSAHDAIVALIAAVDRAYLAGEL